LAVVALCARLSDRPQETETGFDFAFESPSQNGRRAGRFE
jgi:hypothetical protein